MSPNRTRQPGFWEHHPSSYTLEDLNLETFNDFIMRVNEAGRIFLPLSSYSPKQILNTLGLAQGNTLLNAGAALFVDGYFNQLEITLTSADQKTAYRKVYTGSICSLIETGEEFIRSILDWKEIDDGAVCKAYPEIPLKALREALINAFVHREMESMEPVTIQINNSFIEIHNQGPFTEFFSLEEYVQGQGESFRRNPLITRTLYYAKEMEVFATGLRQIRSLCQYREISVDFIEETDGFTVRFHRHSGPEWKDHPQKHSDPFAS